MALPIIFLFLGVFCGRMFGAPEVMPHIDLMVTVTLMAVVFTAGIDVGAKKLVLRKLREYRAKILLVPLSTVAGSLIAGALLGLLLRMPLNEAMSVAGGFGYYSLSAGILARLGGGHLGSLAFITNAFRELLSLLLIPIVAKWLGPYCAIVPGGATTMDTTLGIIARSTNEEATVIAMLHGVILTGLVPIIVPYLYSL